AGAAAIAPAVAQPGSPPSTASSPPAGAAAATQPGAVGAEPILFPAATLDRPAPKVITVERPVVLKSPSSEPRSSAPAMQPPSPGIAIAEAKRLLVQARAAVVAERYAEAEDLYNRVRVTGLERGSALTGLAEVAFQRGSYPEAVRLGHRAVESGGGVTAKMILGNSYFKLGKYDEAIAEYQEVLRSDGEHKEAKANLAAAVRRKGG
ncbi:MAG: Anaphase-promoting complex, cyclosome, subunit 3, partial [Myxococcales bacterium]|nr:Anaphase-promoting complex, cyclosome, subunit 3 [Myxococcales bacterium]